MGLFKWFRKKDTKSSSQFPGERLSIDQILQLENTTEMIIELSYGISDKIARTGFDSLSHAEQVLYRIYWVEAEVNNGGFDQINNCQVIPRLIPNNHLSIQKIIRYSILQI